jgi:hypothetical protein
MMPRKRNPVLLTLAAIGFLILGFFYLLLCLIDGVASWAILKLRILIFTRKYGLNVNEAGKLAEQLRSEVGRLTTTGLSRKEAENWLKNEAKNSK